MRGGYVTPVKTPVVVLMVNDVRRAGVSPPPSPSSVVGDHPVHQVKLVKGEKGEKGLFVLMGAKQHVTVGVGRHVSTGGVFVKTNQPTVVKEHCALKVRYVSMMMVHPVDVR